jgi:hypothetical protein
MRTPRFYVADEIKYWSVTSPDSLGFIKCARPMSWPGINIRKRLKMAWWVFTGKGDVLMWEIE